MPPSTSELLDQDEIKPHRFALPIKGKKFLIAGAVALAIATVAVFIHRTRRHVVVLNKYQVTTPWRTNEALTQQYVGQVRAIQHIEMRALERGYLTEVFVDEGQNVKKGQMMFRIMPLINQAEFRKAEAETDLARIEYENTATLARRSVVSQKELALARAKYEKAKAAKQLAKIHLDLTEIKAPFDGIMGRFHVRLGSLLEEGELLTTLSDNSKMWVYFNVSEAEYLDYKTHAKDTNQLLVHLKMANGKIFDNPGRVETIEADFNNETGNIAFRATFPNPDNILRHGETGNVLVTVPMKNALVIPQKTTISILDKRFVFVVDEKNTLVQREIKIGEEMPHLYVVASGLSETDHILFDGLGRVKQGEKIEVDFLEPAKAMERLEIPAN